MPAAEIAETLQRALPGVSIESWDAADQPVVVVPSAALVDAMRVLRDTPELNFSLLAEIMKPRCTRASSPRVARFCTVSPQ